MHLPDCEKARIADAKLFDYLLNPSHPEGKSKARFFGLIGYMADNGEQLRADLLTLACLGLVVSEQPNPAGIKYAVLGALSAPNGKTYQLLTVWVVETTTTPNNEPSGLPPRLITAYPNNN